MVSFHFTANNPIHFHFRFRIGIYNEKMCVGMVSGDGLTETSSPEQNYGFQQFRRLFFTAKRYDIEINVCINTVIKEEVDEILFSKT